MSNIKIITFGDHTVFTGRVHKKGEEVIKNGLSIIPVMITNKAYNSNTRQMETLYQTVYFTDKLKTLEHARNLAVNQRVHILATNKGENSFASEISYDTPHWILSDGESEMNVMYGNSYITKADEQGRFIRVSCQGTEITFWNDEKTDRAERIRKVFGNGEYKNTYFVTGKKLSYNGKDDYRGYWFICD